VKYSAKSGEQKASTAEARRKAILFCHVVPGSCVLPQDKPAEKVRKQVIPTAERESAVMRPKLESTGVASNTTWNLD